MDPELLVAQRGLLEAWRDEVSAGARRIGWKAGRNIPEVEALMGSEPVLGYITSATVLRNGAAYRAGQSTTLRAETEIVIEVRERVRPDADAVELGRAVGGIGLGLELVDVARPPAGAAGIVAGNVFHRAVVLGPCAGGLRPENRRTVLKVNAECHEASASDVDVIATIRAVARLLDVCGEQLLPGDRILAGALVHVSIEAGDRLAAEIAGLGQVTAEIHP